MDRAAPPIRNVVRTILSRMSQLVGQEYRAFDGKRRWELQFEDMCIVILDTGLKFGRDQNLVGIASDNLRVEWVLGGEVDSQDQYDGIVNVWIRDGALWAGTWSGFEYRLDYKTVDILEKNFTK